MRRARPLLGTLVEIEVTGADESALRLAAAAAFDEIARIHALMSFHEIGSDVGRLNRTAAQVPVQVSPDTFAVLEMAAAIHAASGGAFDIAIAPQLVARGRLPNLHGSPLPGAAGSTRDILLSSACMVRFARQLAIDLGGIAKGYAVDRAIDRLAGMPAVASALVIAGGDLRVAGGGDVPIHVRHPLLAGQLLPPILLAGGALASSAVDAPGPDEVALGPHVLRLHPDAAPRFAAASVCAPTCMVADALTKVVLTNVPASGAILKKFGASALAVGWDGELLLSAGFPAFVGASAASPPYPDRREAAGA